LEKGRAGRKTTGFKGAPGGRGKQGLKKKGQNEKVLRHLVRKCKKTKMRVAPEAAGKW